MKRKVIIGLVVTFSLLSLTGFAQSQSQSAREPAAEIYIKGFKEHFNSLSEDQQKGLVAQINELGKKFMSVLDSADYYMSSRQKRIASLKETRVQTPADRYALNRSILEEYIHCNFDSAFSVGRRNLDLAHKLDDAILVVDSKIDLAKVFIQGGYFREAAEQLDSIDISTLDDTHKADVMLAKFFLEFENGFFFAWNRQDVDVSEIRMKELYSELIRLLPDDAYEIYQLKSTLAFYKHKYVDAIGYCDILLLKDSDPNSWNYITNLGNMGYNKLGAHDYAAAMEYMVKSATLALKKGALNNPALRKIAELFYVVGDDKLASDLINKSMDYAMDYNSKYRIIESAKAYPMINRQLQERIAHSHQVMVYIIIVMAILMVLLIGSLLYSRTQHRKIKKQASIISQYNETLTERNRGIERSNSKLSEIHGVTAVLASKMMNGSSISRELLEKFKKDVSLKLKVRQYDDLPALIETFRKEMKANQIDTDEILLAFFPSFVEQFNQLLKEENRFEIKNGSLPPEVRIFALWRIGLHKNESIARCMGYSLNTIKSYKTRVINASLYDKEEFYNRLMEIKVSVAD